MRRYTFFLWMTFFCLMPFRVCAQDNRETFSPASEERCRQWADSVMSRMSRQQKVGQLLVASIPAEADKERKKLIRELTRKYGIGGLLFSGGTPEEQAILTNLARKSATVPVMVVFDEGRPLSKRLEGLTGYPEPEALQCVGERSLLEEYEQEVRRQWETLGIQSGFVQEAPVDSPDRGIPICCRDAVHRDSVRLYLQSDVSGAVASLLKDVRSGALSEEELDKECRRVLMYKYRVGVRNTLPKLQVSGMSYRIDTETSHALAARLRRSAVTVLNNYFGILPLAPVEGGIALLSVGEEEADAAFVETMKKETDIRCFRLSWNADETAREEVRNRLSVFKRVIVCITGAAHVDKRNVEFLNELDLQAPLVYVCFASYRQLWPLMPALSKSSAAVLAHSTETDLQRHVADVLLAKAAAKGRSYLSIGRDFQAGTGCDVIPGMTSGALIPEDYGMKSYVLQRIDAVARKGVEMGAYPGCRILILKENRIIYDKGFGVHSDKDTAAVRPDDLFDLGSLTKTTATLLAVMKLYDEGRLRLDDKVSKYLALLRNGNKKNITVRELLLHESGLPPYIRFYLEAIDPNSVHGPYSQSWQDQWHRTRVSEHGYYCSDFKFRKGLVAGRESAVYSLHMADGLWLNKDFKNTILQKIAKCELGGKRYVYSDLGFVLLQQMVEQITRMPMDVYLAKEFYEPMGLQRTLFLPLQKFAKAEIMPTASNDFLRRQDLCGYVHDETSACMGGVSGNAGLFSTIGEVARIYQMLLNGGELDGKRYLSEATCRLFTTEKSLVSHRGLGFDRPDTVSVKGGACAASAPEGVYGHTGFTGTCAWVDPESRTVYVFLSNRLCPDVWNTKLGDMNICTDIQELIFKSLK